AHSPASPSARAGAARSSRPSTAATRPVRATAAATKPRADMNVEEVDARAACGETVLRMAGSQRARSQEEELGLPLPGLDDLVACHGHPPEPNPRRHWVAEGGFAMLAVHGPRAAFVQLCVHPERRRRGLGSALLAAVVEEA